MKDKLNWMKILKNKKKYENRKNMKFCKREKENGPGGS